MTKLAIYAGTFDPITLGHIDIIERASELFDRIIVAVTVKSQKKLLFNIDERVSMTRESIKNIKNVEVDSFGGLLVNYVQEKGARVMIRGLRAYSDFEYEFQMALTNRKLAPELETLFMMPKEIHSYVSSSLVREVATGT